MTESVPATVEEYLAAFPDDVRTRLENVRATIRRIVPDTDERISYGIIRFQLPDRHPIYLAGWKKHLGIYPVPKTEGDLEEELAPYRAAKDSLHFPHTKPIPYELIERMITSPDFHHSGVGVPPTPE